jgi:hypothetical protein
MDTRRLRNPWPADCTCNGAQCWAPPSALAGGGHPHHTRRGQPATRGHAVLRPSSPPGHGWLLSARDSVHTVPRGGRPAQVLFSMHGRRGVGTGAARYAGDRGASGGARPAAGPRRRPLQRAEVCAYLARSYAGADATPTSLWPAPPGDAPPRCCWAAGESATARARSPTRPTSARAGAPRVGLVRPAHRPRRRRGGGHTRAAARSAAPPGAPAARCPETGVA